MFEGRVQLYDFRVEPAHTNDPRTKFIERIGSRKRVLEVGCASGQLSAFLTEQLHCEVVGVELNAEAAREAEGRCSRVIVGDVEKDALEHVGGPFDVITFGDVLEHLVAPGAVLSRCKRLLAPEGFVLISVPNIAHYSVRLKLLRGVFEYEQYGPLDNTHLRFFTLKTARRMIEEAGYFIQDFDVVFSMRGWRFVKRGGRVEVFLRKHFAELVGYQFVFKAGQPREQTDGSADVVPPTREPTPVHSKDSARNSPCRGNVPSAPLVYIVILNYNGGLTTLDCVCSVSKLDYPDFRALVVDNASTDGSVPMLRRALDDARFEILVNPTNEGYAGGNNRGIEKALASGADYVFILNNDTIVDPGCLTPLVQAMEEDGKLGIVGCPVVDVRFPDSSIYFWRANLSTGVSTPNFDVKTEFDLGHFDYVSGAAFLIRADAAKRVGMFDARFFLNWEDADLCFRVRRAGYDLKIIESPGIQHLSGQTARRFRPMMTFYSLRNRAWVVRRHGGTRHRFWFDLYNFCYLYPRTILGRLRRGEFGFLGPTLRGIWHGHFAYPGAYAGPSERTGRSSQAPAQSSG